LSVVGSTGDLAATGPARARTATMAPTARAIRRTGRVGGRMVVSPCPVLGRVFSPHGSWHPAKCERFRRRCLLIEASASLAGDPLPVRQVCGPIEELAVAGDRID